MQSRSYAVALLIVVVAFGIIVFQKEQGLKKVVNEQVQVSALMSAVEQHGIVLGEPQKSGSCVLQDNGSLPDPGCTPGAVFLDAGADAICQLGYSKSVRNVTVGLKREMYTAYGISFPQARGSYEMDHLIPLELGGSNDRSNLWPESAVPAASSSTLGFHEKDIVENYLHEQVCNGVINLPAAQKQIAVNWIAVYEALSPDTIARLKQEFPSWTTPN